MRAIATVPGGRFAFELGACRLTPDLEGEYADERPGIAERAARVARRAREDGGPLVAIAMATYEPQPHAIERQLDSIRAQTHSSWICLISDDGSSAEGRAALKRAIGDDHRFLFWPSRVRRGAASNFERALWLVPRDADLVAPADQSGDWYPEKLAVLCEHVGSETPLAYADFRLTSERGEVLTEHWCDPRRSADPDLFSLLASNYVPGANSLFRRDLLDLALPFPPQGPGGRHDHWLAVCARSRGDLHFEPRLLADHVPAGKHTPPRAGAATGAAQGRGWRRTYFGEHARVLTHAATLRTRAGATLAEDAARKLDAMLGADLRRPLGLRRDALRARLARRPARRSRSRLIRAIAASRAAHLRARRRRRLRDRGSGSTESAAVVVVPAAASNGPPGGASQAPAIEVVDLHKTFRIPEPRDPEKGRLASALRNFRSGSLTVLDGVSFEVERGELFGILGRNGSGKSTLLRILGGIYAYDGGSVRVAQRVAPVIELGVGFQPEFAALRNVIINLEMLGVPESEARERYDQIIGFAGLEDFTDLKLRNYSSGMRARLAFSIATQVDADVILLDEVLAVGDPAFQRKCEQLFDEQRKRSGGPAIVLVTQQPTKVQRFADRALLLEGGRIERIGDPGDVAARFAEITLEGHGADIAGPHTSAAHERARIASLRLEDEESNEVRSVHSGKRLHVRVTAVSDRRVHDPGLRLEIRNRTGAKIFAPPTLRFDRRRPLRPGESIEIETGIENKLAPGAYTVNCSLTGVVDEVELAVSRVASATFAVVGGATPTEGAIDLDHTLRVTSSAPERERHRERDGMPERRWRGERGGRG